MPYLATLLIAMTLRAQDIPPSYGQPVKPGIVVSIQAALKLGDLAAAEAMAAQYRNLHGNTPEALQGLGWVARGQLAARENAKALATAADVLENAAAALATRAMDAEPNLPLAVGSAYEVQAQALLAQGKRPAALAALRKALVQWRGTSLVDRLQKNINVMTLQGQPMPALRMTEWIGAKPVSAASLRGKVVLLFFWAHWCADCKGDAPVMAKLAAEMKDRGLAVIAPTRFYGYTAQEENIPPAVEKPFIAKVFEKFYAKIPLAGVPLDAGNFKRYGASTTPTIVLVDRSGIVRLYHPGVMSEGELRAALEPLLQAG